MAGPGSAPTMGMAAGYCWLRLLPTDPANTCESDEGHWTPPLSSTSIGQLCLRHGPILEDMNKAADELLPPWLAALGTCRLGGADLFNTLKGSTGDEHPPYPTHVYFLNGAVTSLSRQGKVAESVRTAAELMSGAAVPYKPVTRPPGIRTVLCR